MSKIAVLDFGGQYAHLIATRLRGLGVYSEIHLPGSAPARDGRFAGVIFSGGPSSVYAEDRPNFDGAWLELNVPVLGLCYGHHLMTQSQGGTVERGKVHEFGPAELEYDKNCPLFKGIPHPSRVWMSHGDEVTNLAPGFKAVGWTKDCRYAALENAAKKFYSLQFHPEVVHSLDGEKMLSNFLDITAIPRDWNMGSYAPVLMETIRKTAEGRKVFLLVSGGVDSTVAFALLNKALGPDRVLGLHIDNGMMRLRESEAVMDYMAREGFDNLCVVDATADFLKALEGMTEPEKKRKAIGQVFLDVKDVETAKLGLNPDEWLLAQGTIYPDTIESGGTKNSEVIKTHHNRVDAILELIEKGLIIEPLAELYKDEVRALGEELGLPKELVWRHPFPGPGLGVRLLCQGATAPEAATDSVQKASELAAAAGYAASSLPVKSVGVQGDGRTYAQPLCLDGKLDWTVLEKLAVEIPNQVRAFNRVVWRAAGVGPFVAVEGYMTRDRLDLLRQFDAAVTDWMIAENVYDKIWQMPVALLPVACGGKEVVVLRPVESREAMTATFWPADEAALGRLCTKLLELGAGSVLYDCTHKPPGTIEWE